MGDTPRLCSSPNDNRVRKTNSVSAPLNHWERYYDSGIDAFRHRIFDLAEQRLLAAERACTALGNENAQLTRTCIALADVYTATESYGKAERLYTKYLPLARKELGTNSADVAQALHGLALVSYVTSNYSHAESLCRQALSIRELILEPDSQYIAESLQLLAKIVAEHGWTEEADELFKQALLIFEKKSGPQNLDLANLLRDMAVFYESQGKDSQARPLFERALAIEETAAKFDQSATLRGLVTFPWNPGSPNCRAIPDNQYPLRYQHANGLRVAVSLINIGRTYGAKVFGALISIANITDKNLEIGLGPVSLEILKPAPKFVEQFEPNPIDRIYLEQTFWYLTWKRPALAKLQITRPSVTKLKGEHSDLPEDYGGNVFGNYGAWNIGPTSLPDIVARERMHARGESILSPGMALLGGIGALGLNPITIQPRESCTGIVFFPAQHFDQAQLKVLIGNVSFEFPFKFIEPW